MPVRLLFCSIVAALFITSVTAQSRLDQAFPAAASIGAVIEGKWTYRSFHNNPASVGNDPQKALALIFAEAGDYCVLDAEAPAASTVNGQGKSRQFLGRVSVAAGNQVSDAKSYIKARLIAAAERFMPDSIRQKVRDDLANDLRLNSFVPHPDIADGEVTGSQILEMKINLGGGPVFLIDGKPFDPKCCGCRPSMWPRR